MGAGQANTPRATVAMITHEVPGDSFWDLIRKGAQAAADKDNIELRYSNDPEAPNQANLVQSAIDSKVNGIAVTLAKPDAMAPAVKAALAAGIPVVAFNSGFDNFKAMGVQEYFGQDEKLAGVAAGERLNKDGAKKVDLRHPGAGPGRARIAMRRRHSRASRGSPRSSTSTARTCRRSSRRSPPSCSRTVRRSRRRTRRADCVGRGAVGRAMPAAPRRSSPSTPTRRSSTRSRPARCSGRWTSSRSCRGIWRSTHCGCTSTTRT